MAERGGAQAQKAPEVVELRPEESILDQLLAKIDTAPKKEDKDQIGIAIGHILDAVARSAVRPERVDGVLIDSYIAALDKRLSEQVDEILHNNDFQKLESAWRSLYFMVNRTNFQSNIRIEVLNVSKEKLVEDFDTIGDPLEGGLFKHIYTNAYDQYGADPVSIIVSNYEFDSGPQDVALMRNISEVAAAAHCPFIAAAGPRFFGRNTFEELAQITELKDIMNTTAYSSWNSFRESENSRYINLALPKFLLRLPYGEKTQKVKGFGYEEGVKAEEHNKYLWGNAAFALAANINRSFADHGWPVNIIGPQSGGTVDDLPLHYYEVGGIEQYKIPVEIKIPDMKERDLAEHGFIPILVHEGKKVEACFFSAYSAQKPKVYNDEIATANSRLSSRLPYILLVSRLSHYLRVIQRDEIGRMLNASDVQAKLKEWIDGYVSGPNPYNEQLKARRPLQEARVIVEESKDKPGVFNVRIFVTPHYHAEEFNIELSLVAEMPQAPER